MDILINDKNLIDWSPVYSGLWIERLTTDDSSSVTLETTAKNAIEREIKKINDKFHDSFLRMFGLEKINEKQ